MEKYKAVVRARITRKTFRTLERIAREENKTLSTVVREVLDWYLAWREAIGDSGVVVDDTAD